MPATLTVDEIRRIAVLAQLELTEDETTLFARQLAEILQYAEQVQALDTTGVPATAHIHAPRTVERDDQPLPSLPVPEALANAPDGDTQAGLFRVPRVIG